MNLFPRRRFIDSTAFTLMEVLVAVTILGLVMAAVYSTFHSVLTAWKRGVEVADTFQRERIVMETLDDLTQSVVYVNGIEPGLYQVTGERNDLEGDSISFVSASDILLPRSELLAAGMRRVTIRLERDEQGDPYLGIANQPAIVDPDDAEEPIFHALSSEVIAFQVRYRDLRDSSWHEEWAEPNLLPSAIQFTVTFAGKEPKAPAVQVSRAIELPSAGYILQTRGTAGRIRRVSVPVGQGDRTVRQPPPMNDEDDEEGEEE